MTHKFHVHIVHTKIQYGMQLLLTENPPTEMKREYENCA